MRNTIAMILAGGRVDELAVLTLRRPKSAVVFAGAYRIIDFTLTSVAAAGIRNVGILSQYRPSSLIDHVGTGACWDLCGRHAGAKMLPPYRGETDSDWYRGTADAVYQNLHYIRDLRPDDVLVVSGDHIHHMDYRLLADLHQRSGAELTMAFTPVEAGEAHRFGVGSLDANGRITSYQEKPRVPRSDPSRSALASMTMFLFRRQVLEEELAENARSGKTFHIYDEIVPRLVARGRAYGVIYDGYWRYTRTLDEYLRAHQDLVAEPPLIPLAGWRVLSNPHSRREADAPPAHIGHRGRVERSLVAAGCVIEGTVLRSVLSPDVYVAAGALVRDSVLMHGTRVEAGATLDHAVVDKLCQVGAGAVVGDGELATAPPNREVPASLACGATILGKGAAVPAGARIGRNCMLYPEVDACDLAAAGARGAAMTDGAGGSTLELPSGEVVWRRVAEWSLADDETPGTAGAGGSSGGGSSARPEEG